MRNYQGLSKQERGELMAFSDCGGTYWPLGVEPSRAVRSSLCKSCKTPVYATWVFCEECWIKVLLTPEEYSLYKERCKKLWLYDAVDTVIPHTEYMRRLRRYKTKELGANP